MTQTIQLEKCSVMKITAVLKLPLDIPYYQRPYTWSEGTVVTLLNDMKNALDSKILECRLGNIILHQNKENNDLCDIVDGQQRLTTLALLLHNLTDDNRLSNLLTITRQYTPEEAKHIRTINALITDFLSPDTKKQFKEALIDHSLHTQFTMFTMVVFAVDEISEAFQLFDSQNSRGKKLDPTDLLKAYHLRAIPDSEEEIDEAISLWRKQPIEDIQYLYSDYLFPIWNWTHKNYTIPFSDQSIGTFKGLDAKQTNWPIVSRQSAACQCPRLKHPHFQISEYFTSGLQFFQATRHYVKLLNQIKNEHPCRFLKDNNIPSSKGLRYCQELYYKALLAFYDRFGSPDAATLLTIRRWSFALRLDLQRLGQDSVNRYALGLPGYSNAIPMFFQIITARSPSEIRCLHIEFKKTQENTERYSHLME